MAPDGAGIRATRLTAGFWLFHTPQSLQSPVEKDG